MKNFFKGISITQLSAGALAAVTSFLLSAKIGIAGSVIGTAVGSVVSAVASQVYQNIIRESSEKIQSAVPLPGLHDADAEDAESAGSDGDAPSDDAGRSTETIAQRGDDRTDVLAAEVDEARTATLPGAGVADASRTAVLSANADGDGTAVLPEGVEQADAGRASDRTAVIGSTGGDGEATGVIAPDGTMDQTTAMTQIGRTVSSADGTPRTVRSGQQPADASTGAKKGPIATSKRNRRIAIIVAVASALLAVGITAAIITLVTDGEGTDHVVRDLVEQSYVDEDSTDETGDGTGSVDDHDGITPEQDSDMTTDGQTTDDGTNSGATTDGSGTSGNTDPSTGSETGGDTGTTQNGGSTGGDSTTGGDGSDSGTTTDGSGTSDGSGASSDTNSSTGSDGTTTGNSGAQSQSSLGTKTVTSDDE